MRYLKQVGFALLALLFVSSVASAQRPRARSAPSSQRSPWELGVDAVLSFDLDTPKSTTLSIPAGTFRAGYFANDALSIEPFFSLLYIKPEGASGGSLYQFGVGGLWHFSTDRTKSQVYVRPFIDLVGTSGGGASNSDLGFGVGGGMKWPKLGGRMALRGEGNIMSINSNTSLNLLFGVSFFTR